MICRRLKLHKIKKFTMCTIFGMMCSCNFKLPVPINPFSKRNRFITAVIYAAYTYNILKIFEFLIVGDRHIQEGNRLIERAKLLQNQTFTNLTNMAMNKIDASLDHIANMSVERGILMDLLKQVCNVIIIGLRYYPVLLCVELKRKSKFCYFITSLYVLLLFFSYIYMNIFCLLSASNAIKDANEQFNSNNHPQFNLPTFEEAQDNVRTFRMMPLNKTFDSLKIQNKTNIHQDFVTKTNLNQNRPSKLNFISINILAK